MIDIILFAFKIAIVALLYLFIWWLVRSALAVLRAPAVPAQALGFAPVPAVDFVSDEALNYPQPGSPVLVVEESPVLVPDTLFALDEDCTTVGRSTSNTITLNERYVSSVHARFLPRGEWYVVEDLGSSNGTVVNGERVAEAQLTPGSRIRIGETVFRYEE